MKDYEVRKAMIGLLVSRRWYREETAKELIQLWARMVHMNSYALTYEDVFKFFKKMKTKQDFQNTIWPTYIDYVKRKKGIESKYLKLPVRKMSEDEKDEAKEIYLKIFREKLDLREHLISHKKSRETYLIDFK